MSRVRTFLEKREGERSHVCKSPSCNPIQSQMCEVWLLEVRLWVRRLPLGNPGKALSLRSVPMAEARSGAAAAAADPANGGQG